MPSTPEARISVLEHQAGETTEAVEKIREEQARMNLRLGDGAVQFAQLRAAVEASTAQMIALPGQVGAVVAPVIAAAVATAVTTAIRESRPAPDPWWKPVANGMATSLGMALCAAVLWLLVAAGQVRGAALKTAETAEQPPKVAAKGTP